MAESYAGTTSELEDGVRRLVDVGGVEVAVYLLDGEYRAFENTCVHMGGPVAEGLMLGRVRAVIGPDRQVIREEFCDDEMQLICPWHGWAYDAKDGTFAGDPKIRLRAFEVEVRGEEVYVRD